MELRNDGVVSHLALHKVMYICVGKTTSTLVYIMAHYLNAMEPNFLTPFLSMIDEYDRLKNTRGNEFILLKRGWVLHGRECNKNRYIVVLNNSYFLVSYEALHQNLHLLK